MPITVTIPETEYWDEETRTFGTIRETTIKLEHSLVSISKWESKWKRAFLGKKEKTSEEMLDYIKCMTLTQNVDPLVYTAMPNSVYEKIVDYIVDPMTASVVRDREDNTNSKDIPTSEFIYYLMIANQIPFSCEKWHLNRLLSLIKICSIKNNIDTKGKKRGRGRNMGKSNAKLNALRRSRLNSTG